MKRLLFLACALAACGGGAANEGPKNASDVTANKPKDDPAEAAKKAAEEEKKKQAAALEEITQAEVKSGQCDTDAKAALDKLMTSIEEAMKSKSDEAGKPIGFTTMDKRSLVFAPDPRTISVKVSGKGTQVHVLALSVEPVSLDMMHEGKAATVRSPFASEMASKGPIEHPKYGKVDAQVDSRIVDVKPNETLEVKVRGQGCGILMSFMKP
jgi:hypothetical protein